MKVTERLEQLAVVSANGHRANLAFVVLLLPNQKNERVLQPDFRF
jgi:hypothetical protein